MGFLEKWRQGGPSTRVVGNAAEDRALQHLQQGLRGTQLGLAAFRTGSMVYAHNCLDDLVNVGSRNGLLRVLLGQQGSQGAQSAQSEEEMVVPAKRVLPAHMVIISYWGEA